MNRRLHKLDQLGADHIIVAVLTVVVVAIWGTVVIVASHAAAPNWKGTLEAFSNNSGYCLTSTSGSTSAKVVLDPCKSADTNQVWNLVGLRLANVLGTTSVQEFELKNGAGTNECLNNPYGSKTSGAAMQLYPCKVSDNASTWLWGSKLSSSKLSAHQLMNLASISGGKGLCLDDAYGAKAAGTKVQVYTCKASGQSNQSWFEGSAPSGSGGGGTSSSSEGIMTALYADPGASSWAQVENATPTVKYSIVNICAPDGSGSGCGRPADEKDPSWAPTIAAIKGKGITPLYYISTNYGAVSLATLESELKNAISWYGIANPMFDETADSGNCSNGGSPMSCVTYYEDLYKFSASSGATAVVYNPGTITPQNYMFGSKEVLMIFEGSSADFDKTAFPSWMSQYPAGEFVATVYAGSSSTIGGDVSHAVQSHIGNFYETDEANPPNYSTLPSYWSTEVSDVKSAQ